VSRYQQAFSANAERRGIPTGVVDEAIEVAHQRGGTPGGLTFLETLEEVKDPLGKSFFLLPQGIGGEDARTAALLTYAVNAGTDYGVVGCADPVGSGSTDFPPTPFCANEIRRIADRQRANGWSYDQDVGFVHRNSGRLVATPDGILMGVGGNWLQALFSARGGTVWGDIFMINIRSADPAEMLRLIVRSGHAWYADRAGRPFESNLCLDRVLHHEERHSRQWAAKGHRRMLIGYGWELLREMLFRKTNRLEADAGLADGGYI
jgi:hypothetical protein